MSNKIEPGNAIEQAMADALAAVERIEHAGKSAKKVDVPPSAAAKPVEPAVRVNGKVDVVPIGVEPKPAPAPAAEEASVPRDQFLRLAADFENYRRRATREMDDARRYGIEKLLKDLLPLLDNLDRALSHAEGDKNPVIEGVRMVAKQAFEILASYGVRAFGSLGEPFDPEQHEAVAQLASDRHPAGSVMEEMVRGYKIHDRLLRPAQVVVAVAPPRAESPPATAPTPTPMDGGTGSGS
jgi:molecular chaperone GrpE